MIGPMAVPKVLVIINVTVTKPNKESTSLHKSLLQKNWLNWWV